MSVEAWTSVLVILSFIVYAYIGWHSRVKDTKGFFVASQGVPAIANGAATAADWMSAASFISMAGLISFLGYDGSIYLMGWTGGYVLLHWCQLKVKARLSKGVGCRVSGVGCRVSGVRMELSVGGEKTSHLPPF
ncbi:sodium:solute symporter family transporter, partial [Coleofasciculus sp. E2-BRE-01]|uniref:sodium:solute symporter family transporter n=1 Tax=Coleofasciculus sp. E2-BRE-01 TaxID=3069524 RepID=UPI0032FE0EA3